MSLHLAANGKTQADLAKDVGCTPSYASQVLTGKKPANEAWLNLVGDALDLSKRDRNKLKQAAKKLTLD